jgi:Na+/proline symporter
MNSEFSEAYKNIQKEQETIFYEKQALIKSFLNSETPQSADAIATANKNSDILRHKAKILIDKAAENENIKVESNDKDYVFIHFILNNLPRGLIGLLLAVILSAAMSSTSSELNALGSTTTMDLYKRNTGEKTEEQMVKGSKWFTLLWGLIAIGVACIANLAENLIQLVNIIGSIFYGNVLGIFLLAFFFKFVKGHAVFSAAIITQLIVIGLYFLNLYDHINLPFLWLNFVGCAIVIMLACLLQLIIKNDTTTT